MRMLIAELRDELKTMREEMKLMRSENATLREQLELERRKTSKRPRDTVMTLPTKTTCEEVEDDDDVDMEDAGVVGRLRKDGGAAQSHGQQ